ncbi:hypothetical protein FHX49_001706 [Microbacterium endophyticum]|uniref:Protein CR006 P-loop domain-containing protein n=3 Tax=Microbacterium endophyticum TaxID=1526412 RepID=A0A7W4YNW9_9MICO|nr:hypothetical protein [Microbacterium endophyticum]NIK36433.1 hypothetical protein [Microbacterium endophyticum]
MLSPTEEAPATASLHYALGEDFAEYIWRGEFSVPPFTRMSIFDSPAVNFHVDDDLDYVYVPTVLSLFNHVGAGIRLVQQRIEDDRKELVKPTSSLLARFPKDGIIYPEIETLGASTDLEALKAHIATGTDNDQRITDLQMTVAALQSNSLSVTFTGLQRQQRVLKQATTIQQLLAGLDGRSFNASLTKLADLRTDQEAFRTAFFSEADLPSEPDDSWEEFIARGADYQTHLAAEEAHDDSRCLYCRQPLDENARALVSKYSVFLLDKIGQDIKAEQSSITKFGRLLSGVQADELRAYVKEYDAQEDKPEFFGRLESIESALTHCEQAITTSSLIDVALLAEMDSIAGLLAADVTATDSAAATIEQQMANRETTTREKKKELQDLQIGVELAKSWIEIEGAVRRAKEADKLGSLMKRIPPVLRGVTELAKFASDQLVNESFDALFIEECEALRAPILKVEFIGRQGKAQRRKVLTSKHRPPKVLSEGEQKVLAMADFLAEARLSGISAPVIFDDPVSSLDHRRIDEVADRVARLAEQTQVIVFTHDVLFAAALISRFEKTKRCRFYQITDEGGKGKVTPASGPRWDSISELAKKVNVTIETARKAEGDARDALVRTGYGWLRSWCEVFTEMELLKGVTQRYQPNVRMTTLSDINIEQLPAAIETVTRLFEDACRYIDSHSQPLPALGVTPTLADLERDWAELKAVRQNYAALTAQ